MFQYRKPHVAEEPQSSDLCCRVSSGRGLLSMNQPRLRQVKFDKQNKCNYLKHKMKLANLLYKAFLYNHVSCCFCCVACDLKKKDSATYF